MYVEIIGRWIAGPALAGELTNRNPASIRPSQPISWPRGEDGIISLRVADENGQPLALNLAGSPAPDSISLSIGGDFVSGAVKTVNGTVGATPGQYLFALTHDVTRDMMGPMVYEVRAGQAGVIQQVCSVAYFTVSPAVASL